MASQCPVCEEVERTGEPKPFQCFYCERYNLFQDESDSETVILQVPDEMLSLLCKPPVPEVKREPLKVAAKYSEAAHAKHELRPRWVDPCPRCGKLIDGMRREWIWMCLWCRVAEDCPEELHRLKRLESGEAAAKQPRRQ